MSDTIQSTITESDIAEFIQWLDSVNSEIHCEARHIVHGSVTGDIPLGPCGGTVSYKFSTCNKTLLVCAEFVEQLDGRAHVIKGVPHGCDKVIPV